MGFENMKALVEEAKAKKQSRQQTADSTATKKQTADNSTENKEETTMKANTTAQSTEVKAEQTADKTTKKLTNRAQQIRNRKKQAEQTAEQTETTAQAQQIAETAQQIEQTEQDKVKAKLETLKKSQLIELITTDKTEQGKLAKLTKNALIECLLVQYAKQTAEPEQTADKTAETKKPEQTADKPKTDKKTKKAKKQTAEQTVFGLLGEFSDSMKQTAEQIYTKLPNASVTGHIKRNKLVVRMNNKVVFKASPYRRNTASGQIKVFTNDSTQLAPFATVNIEPESVGMKYSAQLDPDTFAKFVDTFKAQPEQTADSTAA